MSIPDASSSPGLSSGLDSSVGLPGSPSILDQHLVGDLTRRVSQQLGNTTNLDWQVLERDPFTGVGVTELDNWNDQKKGNRSSSLYGDEFESGIPPIDAAARSMSKAMDAVERATEASVPVITHAVSSTASNVSESIRSAIDGAHSRWTDPDNQTRRTLNQKAEQVTESLKDLTADVLANGNVQNVLTKLTAAGQKLSEKAEDALKTAQDKAEAFTKRLLGQPDFGDESIYLRSVRKVAFEPGENLLGRQAFESNANFGEAQTVPFDADILVQAGLASTDGQLSREEVIAILRSTEDGGVIDAREVNALRSLPSFAGSAMPNYVRVLTEKVVLGDPANNRSGIGELTAGSYAIQMEGLIGKWFLGSDHPVALSYDHSQSFNYNPVEGQLFKYGVSHLDVTQGNLGDCYFLASLGSVALYSPETIQNMFIDNGDGTFTVRFYKDKVEDFVTVDRSLPTQWNGQAVFAGWGGHPNNFVGNELWVALAEKAYAQWNESGGVGQDDTNSYNGKFPPSAASKEAGSGLNGGWAVDSLRQITGNNTAYSQMSTNLWFVPLSNTVDEMIQAYKQGEMIVLTSKVGEFGNESTHAYTLAGYNAASDRFLVYNPHGRFEQALARDQIIEKFSRWDTTVISPNGTPYGFTELEPTTSTRQKPSISTGIDEALVQDKNSFSEAVLDRSKASTLVDEAVQNEHEIFNNKAHSGFTESRLTTPIEQEILVPTDTDGALVQDENSFSETILDRSNPVMDEATKNRHEFIDVHHRVDESVGIEYQVGREYEHQAQIGSNMTLSSNASVHAQAKLEAGVKGEVDVSVSSDGVTAQAEGEVFAGGKASAGARGSTTLGIDGTPVSVGASGQGDAEALAGSNTEGQAGLALTKNNISVGGGGTAFAGAEASAEGNAGLAVNGEQLVEVGATVGAQAGVGVSGNAAVGYEDGKLHFGVQAGLALGLGAKIGFDVSIGVPKFIATPVETVVEVGGAAVETVVEAGGAAVETVAEAGGAAVETVAEAGGAAVETVVEAGGAAVETVAEAGGAAVETAKKVWNKITPW